MKVMIARLIGLMVCCGEERSEHQGDTKVTPKSRAAGTDQKDKIQDTGGRNELPLKTELSHRHRLRSSVTQQEIRVKTHRQESDWDGS